MEAQEAEPHHYQVLQDELEVQLRRHAPSSQHVQRQQRRDVILGVLTFAAVLVGGATLGLTLPGSRHMPAPWGHISSVMGWQYMLAWSVSFYGQLYTNWSRCSVDGLSFDFLALNVTGFVCYAVFNCTMFWSSRVCAEYMASTGSVVRAVDLNDVVFSVHAVAITAFTILQCVLYRRGGQRLARSNGVLIAVLAVSLAGLAAAVAMFGEHKPLTWLNVVYTFSSVKMFVTFIKYIPQVLLNGQRHSTVGWSIMNVLLDLTGGVLSVAQQNLKACVLQDWSIVIGNPVKLGLAVTTLVFDAIFIVQHYFMYSQGPYSKLADNPAHDDSTNVIIDARDSPDTPLPLHT